MFRAVRIYQCFKTGSKFIYCFTLINILCMDKVLKKYNIFSFILKLRHCFKKYIQIYDQQVQECLKLVRNQKYFWGFKILSMIMHVYFSITYQQKVYCL